MRLKKLITGFFAVVLTAVLLLGGMAAGAENVQQPPESSFGPEGGMLFRQSSFDSATGILTMQLRIKPTAGTGVKSGFFAFQYDEAHLTPLDKHGSQLAVGLPNRVRTVALGSSGDWMEYHPVVGDDTGNLCIIKDKYIDSSLEWGADSNSLNKENPKVIYAIARGQVVDGTLTPGYAYLYFDFYDGETIPVDSQGWATVVELKFQCSNNEEIVHDTSYLNGNSIRLPRNAEEAAKIVEQFNLTKTTQGEPEPGGPIPPPVTVSMNLVHSVAAYTTDSGEQYYYMNPPVFSNPEFAEDWTGATPQAGNAAPQLYYEGMDNNYTIQRLSVDTTNTTSGENADFPIPDGLGGELIRYAIPTKAQELANGDNWIAYNYVGAGKTPKQVSLTYEVSTRVTDNSISRPELSEDKLGMGLDNFLKKLSWAFTIKDGTPLRNLTYVEDSQPISTETKNGTTIVTKLATLQTGDEYNGYKVQLIRTTAADGEVTEILTPIGVALDFSKETIITYYDTVDMDTTAAYNTALVPQLRITGAAADPRSYIWARETSTGLRGMIYYNATFEHATFEHSSYAVELQLFREEAVTTSVVVDLSQAGKPPVGISGATAGVTVGLDYDMQGNGTGIDPLVTGVPVSAKVYDQYGLLLENKKVTFGIEPSQGTAAEMEAANKGNIFAIAQGGDTDGKIVYKTGHGPYEAFSGHYLVTAESEGVSNSGQEQAAATIYVTRPLNYLYSIKAAVSEGMISYTEIPPVATEWVIPQLKNGEVTTTYRTPFLLEINSQYARPGTVGTGYKDVVDGFVRSVDGAIDFREAVANGLVRVSFEWSVESGAAPPEGSVTLDTNPQSLTFGTIGVNSKATDCIILYKIHVAYGGGDTGVPEVTKTATGRYSLKRNAPILETITLREPPAKVIVPTAAEVALNGETIIEIVAEPWDQYGSLLTWEWVFNAHAPGSPNNPNGKIFELLLTVDGTLPQGVVQLERGGFRFRVDSTSYGGDFKVYARYAETGMMGPTSKPVTVHVERAPSKLTAISNVSYVGGSSVISPSKEESSITLTPTYKLYDQYGEEMSPRTSGITLNWKSIDSSTTANSGEFSIDIHTGAITIKPCTRDGVSVSVRAEAIQTQPGAAAVRVRRDALEAIKVKRLPAVVELAEISTTSLAYPLSTSMENARLAAKATSQYGESQLVTADGGIFQQWELISVTTNNGEVMADKNEAAGVKIESSTGAVSFARLSDPNAVARAITVRVLLGGSALSESVVIPVTFDSSKATSVDIASATTNRFDVPKETDGTKSRELIANVRDQYGLDIKLPIVWSADSFQNTDSVRFVNRDGRYYLEVDPQASECEVPLTATCAEVGLSAKCTIRVTKGNLKPTRVEINTVETADTVTLPTPTHKTASYQLSAKVFDQYGFQMSTETVTWSITGPAGVSVDAAKGSLQITYSAALRDNDGQQVSIRAVSTTDGSKIGTKTISIKKAAAVPTFATREDIDVTYADTNAAGGKTTVTYLPGQAPKIVVPGRGVDATVVTLRGKVYSQYEERMSSEVPTWSIIGRQDGLSMVVDAATGVGTLKVGSAAWGSELQLQAAPAGNPTATGDMSDGTKSVLLTYYEKGTASAFETELSENNEYTLQLPKWLPNGEYVPDLVSKTTKDYTISAQVLDQYGRRMNETATYPVWELVGAPSGVTLKADQADPRGQRRITGDTIHVVIDHDALGRNELDKEIKVRVYADGENQTSPLLQTITLELVKDAPEVTHVYWVDVDEDGWAKKDLPVPTKVVNSKEYTLKTTVYDQYGYTVSNPTVGWTFNPEVTAYYEGSVLKESEDGENTSFYWNDLLMADLTHSTGKLTLYYTATTGWLPVIAASGTAAPKHGTVSLSWEAPLVPAETEVSQIIVKDESGQEPKPGEIDLMPSEELVNVGFKATVYDQFGYVIETTPDVRMTWSLWIVDQTTKKVIPYVEYDDHKNPLPPEDCAVRLVVDANDKRQCILRIDPLGLNEELDLRIRGNVVYTDGTETTVVNEAPLKVRVIRNNMSKKYVVSYDAGEHGTLNGSNMEEVRRREKPVDTPEVVAEKGYRFLGWTIDGKTLVVPQETMILRDTAFVALYAGGEHTGKLAPVGDEKPVAHFVDGQGNGSFKPEGEITRAEFVKMILVGIIGYDATVDYGTSFADVPENAWYANYFACAKACKLLPNDASEEVRPEDYILREEAAAMLAYALGLKGNDGAAFPDVAEDNWAVNGINALKESSIVNGYPDGNFYPGNALRRSEATKMIVCAQSFTPDLEELKKLAEQVGTGPFADVPQDYWAVIYILSAAGQLN